MASRTISLLSLTTIGVASALVTFSPSTPALADEDPYYRAPPPRMTAPPPRRVVRHVPTTRTVWRPRAHCYDYSGNPVDCRTPVIIGYTYAHTCGGCVPAVVAPPVQYYAPATSCGTCAPAVYPYVHTHQHHGYGHRQYAPGYHGYVHRRYAPRHHGYMHRRYVHRHHRYHVAR
jgi:hypothetical protein